MAGVHVIKRDTDGLNSFVVESTSTLKLPNSASYRANQKDSGGNEMFGVHGAFPEFIHGFYAGYYGFDAGIMYKDGYFWLFYGPYNTGSWKQAKIPSAAGFGYTVTLNTRMYTNGVMLTCSRSGGGSTSMSAPINSDAYDVLKDGCRFVREMVIAINQETDGRVLVPTGASFSSATFSNTDLKMNNGTTKTLNSRNSIVFRDIFDEGTDDDTYLGGSSSSDTGTYINDAGYGSI